MAAGDTNIDTSQALMSLLSSGALTASNPTGAVLGAGISAIPAIYKLITAIHQRNEAAKLSNGLNRPTYNIPDVVNQNIDLANAAYQDRRIPGEAMLDNRISGNTAQTIRALQENGSTPGAIIAGLTAANANANDQYNNIAMQGVQNHNANRAALSTALMAKAPYEDRAFQYNQADPYAMKLRAIGALRQASGENAYSGINDVAGLGTGLANSGAFNDAFSKKAPSSITPDASDYQITPQDYQNGMNDLSGLNKDMQNNLGNAGNSYLDILRKSRYNPYSKPMVYAPTY